MAAPGKTLPSRHALRRRDFLASRERQLYCSRLKVLLRRGRLRACAGCLCPACACRICPACAGRCGARRHLGAGGALGAPPFCGCGGPRRAMARLFGSVRSRPVSWQCLSGAGGRSRGSGAPLSPSGAVSPPAGSMCGVRGASAAGEDYGRRDRARGAEGGGGRARGAVLLRGGGRWQPPGT